MALSRLVPTAYKATYAATQAAVATGAEGTASGGTEVTSGGYKYHVFTGSGTLTVSGGYKSFEYLVVGSGGRGSAGGGGAGGIRSGTAKVVIQDITITIGAGGTGTFGGGGSGYPGNSSSIAWDTTTGETQTITAIGGGGGKGWKDGYDANHAEHGACGGGGASLRAYNSTLRTSHAGAGFGLKGFKESYINTGSNTGSTIVVEGSEYGFNGGACNGTPGAANTYQGAGGGGAAEAGESSSTTGQFYGYGGDGTSDFSAWLSAVSGSVTLGEESGGTYYICGGGAGQGRYGQGSMLFGAAGLGGGGSNSAGDANSGGGGSGADGGSGFVIIRYAV